MSSAAASSTTVSDAEISDVHSALPVAARSCALTPACAASPAPGRGRETANRG